MSNPVHNTSSDIYRRRVGLGIVVALILPLVACGNDAADADVGSDTDTADVAIDTAVDAEADAEPDADDASLDAEPDANDATDTELDAPADGDDVTPDADVAVDVEPDVPLVIPDPDFIFEWGSLDVAPTADQPYDYEETTRFRDIDATTIAAIDGRVWVGTPTGALQHDSVLDELSPLAGNDTATVDIASHLGPDGNVLILSATSITLWTEDVVTVHALPDELTGTSVSTDGSVILIGSDRGVWTLVGNTFDLITGTDALSSITSAHAVGSTTLIVADNTLHELAGGTLTEVSGIADVAGIDVCGDAVGDAATVLVATATDLVVWNDGAEVDRVTPGVGGLPTDAHQAVNCGDDWWLLGHAVGATALRPDRSHIDHYQSGRWLMDDAVRDVAIDSNDARWFATSAGVTRVDLVERTLAQNAGIMQQLQDDHFWRLDGFVSAWGQSPTPWVTEDVVLWDDDNDGQWTQEAIGAWSFAFGATGDEAYCDAARRGVANMLLEIDIPCVSFEAAGLECGFFTRSFVRDDEGVVFTSKADQDNWHLVEYEGRQYYWKDDTSSDEYTGHFFGLPLFYDFCATDEEQDNIASYMALAMDYLIASEYDLIDLDGEPVTFGDWDPPAVSSCVDGVGSCNAEDPFDCATACFGGGFLNAAEVLGFLLATWHTTGDERYYLEYVRLRDEERYAEVLVYTDNLLTFTNPRIENHFDHELAFMAFHTLIRYEADETYRAQWQQAVRDIYDDEIDEDNPFWAGITAGLTGYELDRAAAIEGMQEMQTDTRWWGFNHNHRLDITVRPELDRRDLPQYAPPTLPYDEQPTRWWDQNPYLMEEGPSPRRMRGAMAYIIGYWSMRYYGLLE